MSSLQPSTQREQALEAQLSAVNAELSKLSEASSAAQESYFRRQKRYEEEIERLRIRLEEVSTGRSHLPPPSLSALRKTHRNVVEAVAAAEDATWATSQRSSAVAIAFRAQLQDVEDQLEAAQRRVGRADTDEQLALWSRRSEALERLCAWLEQECGRLHAAADSSLTRAEIAECRAEELEADRQRAIEQLVQTRWSQANAETTANTLAEQLRDQRDECTRLESAVALAAAEIAQTQMPAARQDFASMRAQIKSLRLQLSRANGGYEIEQRRAEALTLERNAQRAKEAHMAHEIALAFAELRRDLDEWRDADAGVAGAPSRTDEGPFGFAELSQVQRKKLIRALMTDDATIRALVSTDPPPPPAAVAVKHAGASPAEILQREVAEALKSLQ